MKNISISIIVPVFNAERHLKKCLESIIAQTFTDWECILVDDGSKDSSGDICDEYAKGDSRFVVIHKDNDGVSSARQEGTNRAQGNYIIHVDSDDWVEPNMLLELFKKAQEGADVVIADYWVDYDDSREYKNQVDVEGSHSLLKAILEGKCMGALWNKLIKRSLFNGVEFPLSLFYSEDVYVLANILLPNKSLNIVNVH